MRLSSLRLNGNYYCSPSHIPDETERRRKTREAERAVIWAAVSLLISIKQSSLAWATLSCGLLFTLFICRLTVSVIHAEKQTQRHLIHQYLSTHFILWLLLMLKNSSPFLPHFQVKRLMQVNGRHHFFHEAKNMLRFISETLGKHQIQISKVVVAHCDMEIWVTTQVSHIKCSHLDKSFSPLASHHVNMQHKKQWSSEIHTLSRGL